MPIKFPDLHIAESVVNRILNIADEIKFQRPAKLQGESDPAHQKRLMDGVDSVLGNPNVPNSAPQGQQIDQALTQPSQPMPAPSDGPNGPAVNTLEATISGGTPLQGLLDGISVG